MIDHVAYCPHAPDAECACRKPEPGLVLETLHTLGMADEPGEALLIGDSIRDIEAAHAAGVPALLVESGYGDKSAILARARQLVPSIRSFRNLAAAVDFLLGD